MKKVTYIVFLLSLCCPLFAEDTKKSDAVKQATDSKSEDLKKPANEVKKAAEEKVAKEEKKAEPAKKPQASDKAKDAKSVKQRFDKLAFISFEPPLPPDVIKYDLQQARRLVIDKEGKSYVNFAGTLKEGYRLRHEGDEVPLGGRKFSVKVSVTRSTQKLDVQLIDSKGKKMDFVLSARAAPLLEQKKTVKAEKKEEGPVPDEWKYGHVFFGNNIYFQGMAVFQKSGGNSFSPAVAWAPQVKFSPTLGVRGMLGLILLKKITGGMFLAGDYQILGTLDIMPVFSIEVGGGAQTWFNFGGTRAVASLYLVAHRAEPRMRFLNFLSFVDGFFIGYTAFLDSDLAHQIKVGVNLTLF